MTTEGGEQQQLGEQLWALDADISDLAGKFKIKHKEAMACEQMYVILHDA